MESLVERAKTLTLVKAAGAGETHLKEHKFHLVGWSRISDRDIFAATGATSRTGSTLSAWLPSFSSSLHASQVSFGKQNKIASNTNCIVPGAVAFGGLMGDKTENLIGISETLIVSSISGNFVPQI